MMMCWYKIGQKCTKFVLVKYSEYTGSRSSDDVGHVFRIKCTLRCSSSGYSEYSAGYSEYSVGYSEYSGPGSSDDVGHVFKCTLECSSAGLPRDTFEPICMS